MNAIALERYAYLFFLRAAETAVPSAGQSSRLRAAALDPRRMQEVVAPRPRVPLAAQLWLGYLLWLEETLQTLSAGLADVSAAELAGLFALARARSRFLREHRFCPHCEAPNPRPARRCRRCQKEF